MEVKQITIVGCGPGALDHVTPIARHAIESAQILAGTTRLIELFPHVTAERIVADANVPRFLDAIAARMSDRRVVILVTGDPGLCSMARPIIRRFGHAACRVIPGISSVQVACARLGLDWAGARILSAHVAAPEIDPAGLAAEHTIAVLAGNAAHAGWLEALVRSLLPTHDIFFCENLTLPDESVRQLDAAPSHTELASTSLLVLVRKEVDV